MYNFSEVEKKWQKYWEENHYGEVKEEVGKKKQYNLVEFPYPSGSGMHLGHIKAYIGMEVKSRKQRMQGLNVLFPIGFDAFGLPAENYAIKVGRHPKEITEENIETFTRQLKSVGFSFDMSRIINTTDPKYYKWTQWIFCKLFEHNLAYRDRTYVNYCPTCKVVLSNEDSQGGRCDRCDSEVIQKEKDVWFLKITEYADKLLDGLNEVDYPNRVRVSQENWIGKSTGAYVDFKVKEIDYTLKVYTTRPDTLFGATFMVIAPEHPLIDENKDKISNMDDINNYRTVVNKKSEFERTQLVKDKTGVKVEGLSAINPVNQKEIPIYIADYVMMGYGTGAIMAVPAHDDRDYEFATKFNVPIIEVIAQETGEKRENESFKNSIVAVVCNPKDGKFLTINWKDKGGRLFVGGTIKENETPLECALREIKEETGYSDIELVHDTFMINHHYYAFNKDKAFNINCTPLLFTLKSETKIEQNLDDDEVFNVEWVDDLTVLKEIKDELHITSYKNLLNPSPYIGDGVYVNSDFLNGIQTKKEAIEKMNKWLEEKGIGKAGIQYKMKDWAFNRQRYWGEPIPIVYCDKCGMVAVSYEELPLELPELEKFAPGEDGESPLANVTDWVNCKCPKCGGDAKRETDTMPQWAGSSWYYLRYLDPFNNQELCSKDKMEYWMNVDVYNGGAEHITRHMIYSRFWHHFLYDIGVVNTPEPYKKRTTIGLILGSDGKKMSKSLGNVVNPDEIVAEYGADVLRTYVLFMGDYGEETPWNEQGVKGVKRFLDRTLKLEEIINDKEDYTPEFETAINKAIKKVDDDIENLKYNTAIAELMKLINMFYDKKEISKKDFETFITLLYPFAPHMAEELNEKLGRKSLINISWPEYNESKIIDDVVTIAVSVNGKLRGTLEVAIDLDKDTLIEEAKKLENVLKYISGKEIVKEIFVPNKIVNIVVK